MKTLVERLEAVKLVLNTTFQSVDGDYEAIDDAITALREQTTWRTEAEGKLIEYGKFVVQVADERKELQARIEELYQQNKQLMTDLATVNRNLKNEQ